MQKCTDKMKNHAKGYPFVGYIVTNKYPIIASERNEVSAVAKPNKSTLQAGVLIAAVIVCAILARVFGNLGYAPAILGLIRTMLYIGLYMAWGVSVRKRVVQAQVRKCLTAVSVLTVFWFVVRSMKYYFVFDPGITRYLWYLYYLPMLFIPLLGVYVSVSLGKPEHFQLKWSLLLFIPTMLCLLLVLTNDFHQLVFTFPTGEVWSDENNGYVPGYYIVIGWEIVCALTAFIMMVIKCRISPRKKHLPIIILGTSIVYAFIYFSGVRWMRIIGGDITAVQCLMFTAVFESCIQCGLIQTNTGYDTLFEVGTFGAQIVDTENRTHYAAANAPKLSEEAICEAEIGTVRLDKNTLLKSSRINGGHVLWQEDITDIAALLEQLEENRETIAQSNNLERENYNTKLKINAVREKNRIYDLLQQQTVRQIELINKLLAQYDAESDEDKRRSLLAKIAVVGAYIKRRGNLMFIGEKSETMDISELSLCLDESFANLELMNVKCAIDIPKKGLIFVRDAVRIYDFFETVTEESIENLHFVWLKVRSLADAFIFYLEVVCEKPLSDFEALAEHCDFEDGVWRFTLRIGKAGEQV